MTPEGRDADTASKIEESLDCVQLDESADNKREEALQQRNDWLDRIGLRVNAETRGVERVPEDKREDTSWVTSTTIFLSPTVAISGLSTGMLGPTYFELDFRTCVYCAVFTTAFSALPVGLFAVFGAKFGLRQQILSRYFTGNIMGRVFALFNVISCIGWNAINMLAAVQMLVSLGPLPAWAGCLIFVVITCAFSFLGYKVIHLYEKWSWIPNVIVYIIMAVRLAKSKTFVWGEMKSGKAEAGNVLSYMTTIFGFIAGWTPSAADYFVYMPSDTPPWKIVASVVAGLSFFGTLTFILGSACGMATYSDPSWAAAFDDNAVGGIVSKVLVEDSLHGFGQFCVVILAMSAIACNLPGSYSLALATQAIWSPLAKVPRLAWCLFGNFLSLALAIPAYYVFEQTMSNFLSIVSYNVSIYIGITLAEHFIYRRGFDGYDLTDFEDRRTLPVGIAGVMGFLFGVASTILSMNQSWYTGVIARSFGENGGDLSFELNVAFAFVGYNLVRPFEKRYFKR